MQDSERLFFLFFFLLPLVWHSYKSYLPAAGVEYSSLLRFEPPDLSWGGPNMSGRYS